MSVFQTFFEIGSAIALSLLLLGFLPAFFIYKKFR